MTDNTEPNKPTQDGQQSESPNQDAFPAAESVVMHDNTSQNVKEYSKRPSGSNAAAWICTGVFGGIIICFLALILVFGKMYVGAGNGSSTASSSFAESSLPSDAAYEFSATKPQIVGNDPLVLPTPSHSAALSLAEIYDRLCPSIVRVFVSNGGSLSYNGTGFIISEDGYIITNAHVVTDYDSISVQTHNEQTYEASLIGYDSYNDVAMLKIDAEGLAAAELGDSDSVRVGEEVCAIGGPTSYELSYTMTHGIVSALRYDILLGSERPRNLIQTDTPINKGSSGSPLVNKRGQVIGINSLKLSSKSQVSIEGLAFAVPINTAKELFDEFISYGRSLGTPAIGITDTGFIEASFDNPAGMLVGGVIEGSDAEKKGILAGDIISSFNGSQVTGLESFIAERDTLKPFDSVDLIIYREGDYISMTIILGEFLD